MQPATDTSFLYFEPSHDAAFSLNSNSNSTTPQLHTTSPYGHIKWFPHVNFHRTLIFRLSGSAIKYTVTPAIFFTLWSASVWCIARWSGIPLQFVSVSLTVVNALAIALGFLLVFRSNSAYERYWQARTLWGDVMARVRALAQIMYFTVRPRDVVTLATTTAVQSQQIPLLSVSALSSVGNGKTDSSSSSNSSSSNSEAAEKAFALKLVRGFPRVLVRYLRGYRSSLQNSLKVIDAPITELQSIKFVEEESKSFTKAHHIYGHVRQVDNMGYNAPLQLLNVVVSYLGDLDPAVLSSTNYGRASSIIQGILECHCGLERILRTPIPPIYLIHLSQILFLYCMFVPFALYVALDWVMIPFMTALAFTLYGIDGIGHELDPPLGLAINALPMALFVLEIEKNIDDMMKPSQDQLELRGLMASLHHAEIGMSMPTPMAERPAMNDAGSSVPPPRGKTSLQV